MAPSSAAAAPDSLITPPAEDAVEQMLQASTQDGARQAVETRSLTHGLPPPTETDDEARLRSAHVEHRVHPAARWCWVLLRGRRDSGAADAAASEEAMQPGPMATADSADGPAGRLRSAEQR